MKWLAPKVKEDAIKVIIPVIDPIGRKIGVIDEHGRFHFIENT